MCIILGFKNMDLSVEEGGGKGERGEKMFRCSSDRRKLRRWVFFCNFINKA